MGEVIQLFKESKPLTNLEMHAITSRMDEIEELFEQDLDEDIHDNLISEMEGIQETLEKSLDAALRLERLESVSRPKAKRTRKTRYK